jgi:uncharacterized membrane protein
MAAMTVWTFPTANGAAIAEETLRDLRRRELIRIHDAAIVTYPEGRRSRGRVSSTTWRAPGRSPGA